MDSGTIWKALIVATCACMPLASAQAQKTVSQDSIVTYKSPVRTAGVRTESASTPVDQNQCVVYTYDANGNRLTQINGGLSASPTWGAYPYPCFT